MVGRVVVGLLLAATAAVQPASKPPDRELAVGVFEAPPYALKSPAGEWRGFSVDLWRELAKDLGLHYRLVEKTEDEILEELTDGRLDLAVGPFAVTMERQRVIDFSHIYLQTGLSLAVRRRSRTDRILDLFRTLATSGAAHIIGGIVLLSAVFGAGIWLMERRHNPQFPARPAAGIGSGAWWAGVTATGVGYGDKVPITLRGRLLAIVWMLVSVVLYVLVTASLTATLAVSEFQQARNTESLRHSVVGALGGSASADFLRRNQVPHRLFPSYRGVLEALNDRKIDAVLVNDEILRYYADRAEGARLELLPQTLMIEDFAFPLGDGSALREPLDRALRRSLAGPHYRDLKDQYLYGPELSPGGS